MPVFTRVRDGVLVLTVDGDYTSNELRRVAFRTFESDEVPELVPVLLDMSGAAGLANKSEEELKANGAVFAAYRDRISGIGVVASADAHKLFTPESAFGGEAGVAVKPCQSHVEAREWLTESESP